MPGRGAGAAIAGAVFVAAGWCASRPSVTATERRCFDAINQLPATIYPAVWSVMQSGSLGGVVAAGGVAAAVRHPVASRLLVTGTVTWLGAKGIKHLVRRGRPSAALASCRTLGRPQTGLGYPSGHAAVAATLATLAAPALPRSWRPWVWTAVAATAAGRVYVGAHLPLDVLGGAALGYATGAAAAAVMV